jgi:bifunctional non-homologous end joining protein LigD
LKDLHATLRSLDRATSPFEHFPNKRSEAKDVQWVRPKLVAEISFSNWTQDGLLRHPVFQGLREDKKASDVVHDIPISAADVRHLGKKTSGRGAKR